MGLGKGFVMAYVGYNGVVVVDFGDGCSLNEFLFEKGNASSGQCGDMNVTSSGYLILDETASRVGYITFVDNADNLFVFRYAHIGEFDSGF